MYFNLWDLFKNSISKPTLYSKGLRGKAGDKGFKKHSWSALLITKPTLLAGKQILWEKKKQFPQQTIPTAPSMLGPCRVPPWCLPPTTTFGESGNGAFKSLLLDPCCGILLNAELQKIHLFKPALHPPHTNGMVYKIQTLLPSHNTRSCRSQRPKAFLPIPQPSTRRPSGDISPGGWRQWLEQGNLWEAGRGGMVA